MEVDPATLLRLKKSNQTHLISYWDQLDFEQRAILIRDITNVDLDLVTKAFDDIKDQLPANSSHSDKDALNVDDFMQPIPEHLHGSVDKTSKDQLERYRHEGWLTRFVHAETRRSITRPI